MHENLNYQLNLILHDFEIAQKNYSISILNNGLINDTYVISLEQQPVYVLQRINHKIFEDIEGLMQNIALALPFLKTENYTSINLVKTKSNTSYLSKDGCFWRLMTYIAESITYNTTKNKVIAFEAGRIIGTFHNALQHVDAHKFSDTIPRFHDLTLREYQFHEALTNAEHSKKNTAKEAIDFALKMIPQIKALHIDNLPIRICHNDTKLNNILFSKQTQKALCLIDLDTIMKGHFYYDFGDAVRTLTNTASEDEKDHSKITFEKELFISFIDGLVNSGIILTKKEIETLSLGAVLMPFLHGIRALTDYLDNDRYYKVVYDNQNLDRSLSLFNFSQKAVAELKFMNTVISKKTL